VPSLIDFRRRIRSVKNTQQITKAMKMVAAAKLRRAQDRVIAARPYGNSLRELLRNIAAAMQAEQMEMNHPLLEAREQKRIQLILLTSDRGLAGAFSMNAIKQAQQFLADHPGADILIECVGRKGRDYFRRRGAAISGEHVGIVEKAKAADARAIAAPIIERYTSGEIDAVWVIGNEFKSVMSQRVAAIQLLPIQMPAEGEAPNYLFDGDRQAILAELAPRYVESVVLRMLLESGAAEHAARMTAMDAATRNASEVIDKLTLHMNRVRQASITKEIIEVVSGAQAL
jgi:F-type H+-transporting ATPase subunit gamma